MPFHNVEKYIEECIRSLYNQDILYDEYEVIAVNDYTKDESRNIVVKLLKEYTTLKLIDHEQNKRQGGARNTGLKAAKGKYVWFVDSDDYIKPNILNHLIKIVMDNQLQILHFDYVYVKTNGCIEEVYSTNYLTEVLSGKLFIHHDGDIWWKKCIEVWRKIYEREFLISNNLYFDEDVFYEDFIYSLETLYKTDRMMHVPETPYCYRVNPSSFTNSKDNGSKLSESVKLSIRCIDFSNFVKTVDLDFLETLISFAKLQLNIARKGLIFLPQSERCIFFNEIKSEKTYKIKHLLNIYDYLLITNSFFAGSLLLIYKSVDFIRRRFRNKK